MVVGFEPFKTTYNQALANIGQNEGLKDRIITHQYGLGGTNRRIRTDYSFDLCRFASIYGYPENLLDSSCDMEEIEIRNAAEVVREIKQEFPNRNIIMKIDCEGSEYEIIDSLYKNKLLGDIYCLIMRWHIREPTNDPAKLVSQLEASNFVVIETRGKPDVGSLYAFHAI